MEGRREGRKQSEGTGEEGREEKKGREGRKEMEGRAGGMEGREEGREQGREEGKGCKEEVENGADPCGLEEPQVARDFINGQ